MSIDVKDAAIPEIKIISGNRFYDERGFFTETYKESEYEDIGIPRFVQDNVSESKIGVIRGLHWQESPFAQGKLVTCIFGSIFDVAVDIRKGSPTFGQHIEIELNGDESKAIWIPEGFAHGFQALTNQTKVQYKVTNYWKQTSEKSILATDPKLEIKWPIKNYVLSEKDRNAPVIELNP